MSEPVSMSAAQKAAMQRILLSKITSFADLQKLQNSSVSLFGSDIVTDEQKENAYIQYSQQLLNEYYDLNKDGQVTQEEFSQVESTHAVSQQNIKSKQNWFNYIEQNAPTDSNCADTLAFYDTNKDGKISEEEYQAGLKKSGMEDTYKDLSFVPYETGGKLFGENLDMNQNGLIDAEELAFFNKTADGLDGAYDGVIINKAEIAMFGSVTGKNAANPEFNRVVNKYLSGETLTADEQKILLECQKTVRAAMGKAAGFDINS